LIALTGATLGQLEHHSGWLRSAQAGPSAGSRSGASSGVEACLSTAYQRELRAEAGAVESNRGAVMGLRKAPPYRVSKLDPMQVDRLDRLGLRPRVVEVPYSGSGRGPSPPIPRALRPPSQAPPELDPRQVRFMQSSISNHSAGKEHAVMETALDLREGRLRVSDLPVIRVWRDEQGRVWSLDHRRLASFLMAGNLERIPVEWVGPEVVSRQSFKFTTQTEGRSVLMTLGKGLGVELEF